MNDDMKKILKMVEDGKITADEASVLIDALKTKDNETAPTSRGRSIKIYVYDKVEDKKKVDITIPLSLIKFGLKFIPKDKINIDSDGMQNIDFDEIMKAVEDGAQGTILDVDEDRERVIIKVE